MRLLFAACAACLIAADAPEPAVDGKSLAGWDYLPAHWKAEDGMIVGHSDGSLKFNTFLCSRRSYRDFEMSFRVRLVGGAGNSGVQIRSEVTDRNRWIVKGPQCDIGDKYWGSLYGENFGGMMQASDFSKVKPALRPDDFNDYFIRCVGRKVTIRVNGVTTVDAEFEKLPPAGIIALQVHQGPKMRVEFKEIVLKEIK